MEKYTDLGSNLKQSFHFSIHSLMKASKSEASIRQNTVLLKNGKSKKRQQIESVPFQREKN